MINRINLILKAKNITAKQFAEEIGIQPSGMSHIMGGRNNPSLEFVSKVLRRYPELDANWLLLGRGEMYASGAAASPAPAPPSSPEPTLFSAGPEDGGTPIIDEVVRNEEYAPSPALNAAVATAGVTSSHTDEDSSKPAARPAATVAPRRAKRIIIMYGDGTFSEYLPDGVAADRQ